jgi:hypothetical protein
MDPSAAFAEIFDAVPEPVAMLARDLHETVLSQHAQAVVVAYPGYDAVSYGFGVKKNSEAYLYLMPQKDRCNLRFYRGSLLADPARLLEGSGKDLRHVKVKSVEQAKHPTIAEMIAASIAERRAALGVN